MALVLGRHVTHKQQHPAGPFPSSFLLHGFFQLFQRTGTVLSSYCDTFLLVSDQQAALLSQNTVAMICPTPATP